jgi:hypothetical protein
VKPLLVGELNPYGPDDEFALWPAPPGCAGHRLCHRVLGLEPEAYLERFDRANLCAHAWSARKARERAALCCAGRRQLVLLGRKVWAAFGIAPDQRVPFSVIVLPAVHVVVRGYAGTRPIGPDGCLVLLPHPSGRCREWNRPGAYERARAVLRSVGAL